MIISHILSLISGEQISINNMATYHPIKDTLTIDRTAANLRWKNVTVRSQGAKGQEDKAVLNKAKGYVNAGEFMAIMGPSGAGKTTLLNILSMKNMERLYLSDGVIELNNHNINSIKYKNTIGFVPQEDILIATLTPRESIRFSADLTLDLPSDVRAQKVEKLLTDLGLQACSNTKIGGDLARGVSGGERKRASIGVELICDPPVLFLDEPTTGLDSFTAEQIINLITSQAKDHGRTILATIHQPNSHVYSLFDRLLLLAKGETVYIGRADRAVGYFEQMGYPVPKNYNPSDHYMNVLSSDELFQDHIDKRIGTFSMSFNQTYNPMVLENLPVPEPYSTASVTQTFTTLIKRSFLANFRDPLVTRAKAAKLVVQILLTIGAFSDLSTDSYPEDLSDLRDRDGALFCMLTVVFMESMLGNVSICKIYVSSN
jgi:ABC-type multidrug transport system ATPase subunit